MSELLVCGSGIPWKFNFSPTILRVSFETPPEKIQVGFRTPPEYLRLSLQDHPEYEASTSNPSPEMKASLHLVRPCDDIVLVSPRRTDEFTTACDERQNLRPLK